MDRDELVKQYVAEYHRAKKQVTGQGMFMFVMSFYTGYILIDDTRPVGILMFVLSGVCACSCIARLAILRGMHRSRIYQHTVHVFYRNAIENLYRIYGHDAVDKAAGPEPVPPDGI